MTTSLYNDSMNWTVTITKKARKQREKLPKPVLRIFNVLLANLREFGAYQPQWKNFGKLTPNKFHCHIKKGQPTYVAIWEIRDKEIKLIEVKYVGTHENAPYS